MKASDLGLTTLQTDLEKALYKHHVAGASIAVFHRGQLSTASAGIANATTGIEITDDTLMQIGSIAKVFTTTLVMQLVDEGFVHLNDPILKHLPDLKIKDQGALNQITIKMLLNHTSGIDGELLPNHGHDEETIEKAIQRFAQLAQIHTPGEDCSYCNAATVIAGYLAQKVSCKSWYDLIKTKIFEPLGMTHSVALPEDTLLYRASVGHNLHSDTQQLQRTTIPFLPLSFAPAGATLMTTAQDLITFARTHMAYGLGPNGVRILSTQSARAMQKRTAWRAGMGDGGGVGLGWMVLNNSVIGHGGGTSGNISMLYAHSASDFAAAILTNTQHGGALINEFMTPWLQEVANILPLLAYKAIDAPAPQLDGNLSQYVGRYENNAVSYEIAANDKKLSLSKKNKITIVDAVSVEIGSPVSLIFIGSDQFVIAQHADGSSRPILPTMMISFRNPDVKGHFQHVAINGRLYRKTANAS